MGCCKALVVLELFSEHGDTVLRGLTQLHLAICLAAQVVWSRSLYASTRVIFKYGNSISNWLLFGCFFRPFLAVLGVVCFRVTVNINDNDNDWETVSDDGLMMNIDGDGDMVVLRDDVHREALRGGGW